jgi:hypothetical protein
MKSFAEIARAALAPTLAQYLMHESKSSRSSISFASERAEITLSYDSSRSFELSVQLTTRLGHRRTALIHEALRAGRYTDWRHFDGIAASDLHILASILEEVRDVLQQDCEGFLLGSEVDFFRVEQLRRQWSAENSSAKENDKIRIEADAAWVQKDFQKFLYLVSSLPGTLSSSEKLKVSIARKKLGISET